MNESRADLGDYLKVFASTAVIMQPIIAWGIQAYPQDQAFQIFAGMIINLVKFTAPAFIYGILFSTTRQWLKQPISYRTYLKRSWWQLFLPTIIWTLLYMLVYPGLVQHGGYGNWWSYLSKFVNGNAAPHLWYNTMMLQFVIFMPVFWSLTRFAKPAKRAFWLGNSSLLFQLVWYVVCSVLIFTPANKQFYWVDRLGVSFLAYGVLGTLAAIYWEKIRKLFAKYWLISFMAAIIAYYLTNGELACKHFPVAIQAASYYKPSMMLYDLAVIGVIGALAVNVKSPKINALVHNLSGIAYLAYLSNVFWSRYLWELLQQYFIPQAAVILCYLASWVLSFLSAYLTKKAAKRIRS